MKPKFSSLFVLGLSHCGSTLLGRMLGSHPDVAYVGELLRLEQALTDPEELCSCGRIVSACPVWQRRVESLPLSVRRDFRYWTWELFEGIRKIEDKALLVDSSKSRVLRLKSRWSSPPVGYVHMVRDPRGALRRVVQTKGSLPKVLSSAIKWARRYEKFSQQCSSVCLTMFYRDLVSSPEAELKRLCEFLGLEYTPSMLFPNRRSFHLIRASQSPFAKGTEGLKLDERWRCELTSREIETIGRRFAKLATYRKHYKLAKGSRSSARGGWLWSLFGGAPEEN